MSQIPKMRFAFINPDGTGYLGTRGPVTNKELVAQQFDRQIRNLRAEVALHSGSLARFNEINERNTSYVRRINDELSTQLRQSRRRQLINALHQLEDDQEENAINRERASLFLQGPTQELNGIIAFIDQVPDTIE
tara:strand:- start:27 stop:431 length:405 start_codon:yes stop_codon:yes gene_type:complete